MLGHAPFGAGQHLVLDADVGKRATHHHAVIATTRTVGVEVLLRDAMLFKVLAGRRAFLDRASRRDVVGRDVVTQQRQQARTDDVATRLGFGRDVLEVRRILHVGG